MYVHAYAGSSSPETPRSLVWEGQTYLVHEVIKQWREVNRIGFLVICTPDQMLFELISLLTEDQWQVNWKGFKKTSINSPHHN